MLISCHPNTNIGPVSVFCIEFIADVIDWIRFIAAFGAITLFDTYVRSI